MGASSSHPHHYVRAVHRVEVTLWRPRGSTLHGWLRHRLRFTLGLRFTFRLGLGFRLRLSLWFWLRLWFWFSFWLWLWTWRRVRCWFCGLNNCLTSRPST